jgi:hypothetical protein
MCIGDVVDETHKCINTCPVCHILTPENILQLLSGASIRLGIVDVFVEVASQGCRMCKLLCVIWKSIPEQVEYHVVCSIVLRLTVVTDLPIRG